MRLAAIISLIVLSPHSKVSSMVIDRSAHASFVIGIDGCQVGGSRPAEPPKHSRAEV